MSERQNSSGEESEVEGEATLGQEIISSYHAHLCEHANQLRSHLSGGTLTLASSFLVPNSYWTGVEKAAFFHALAVHSRLRPDLIAEEVKTKTIPEVCIYLHMLDDALSGKAANAEGDKLYKLLPRREFPTAYEVSEKWIAFEEKQSLLFAKLDYHSSPISAQQRRNEEVREFRNTIRARRGEGRTEGNKRDREGEKARNKQFEAWLKAKKEEWEMSDIFESLDETHLKVMDTIIREDEDIGGLHETSGVLEGTGTLRADPEETEAEASESMREGDGGAHVTGAISDEMIDPALLSMNDPSETSNPKTLQPEMPSNPIDLPREMVPLLSSYDTFNPSTPPFSFVDQSVSSNLEVPLGDPSTPQEGIGLEPLSPASRRRLQKRLYMRRKRAEATGATVDQKAVRLKPGRKGKKVKVSQPVREDALSPSSGIGNIPTDNPGPSKPTTVGSTGQSHPSGKTLPYRIKVKLESAGINANRLREEGLDLFHLSGLARLMQTYNIIHDVSTEVNSELSVSTIKLLIVHVMQFTAQVVRRAIVSREQEVIAKMHTKAWRLTENQVITATNVVHALSLVGIEKTDKKAHFDALLRELGLQESPQDDNMEDSPKIRDSFDSDADDDAEEQQDDEEYEEEDEDDEYEDDVEVNENPASQDDATTTTKPLPLHKIIFPPDVRLPSSLLRPTPPDSVLAYLPWGYDVPPDTLEEDGLFDLQQDDSEDEALRDELEQEDELDKLDIAADKVHERHMWEKVTAREKSEIQYVNRPTKRKRKRGDDDDADVQSRGRRNVGSSLHKGAAKSVEFIVDSD